MIGKRFLLITGGAVGGLGVVLSITPPPIGSTGGLVIPGGTRTLGSLSTPLAPPPAASSAPPAASSAPRAATTTSTPAPTKAAKTRTKKKKKATTPAAAPTKKSTPTPASTPTPKSTPAAAGVSGTFTGVPGNTRFGPVQVQITVANNKITNAVALVYPIQSFRDQQINQQAIPYLIQETLAAQSANIQGVGGASYTSQGWVDSLQSALTKAGL